MSIINEINQLSIFDMEETKDIKTKLEKGDKVMIRFYIDELELVRDKYLYLMGTGILIKKKHDFWLVDFNGKEEWVEENRLKIHS